MALTQQPCEPLAWEEFLSLLSRMAYDVHLHESLAERKKLAKYELIIASGGYLGLRGSDLLKLKWKDFFSKKSLVLLEGKTAKKKTISLNPELIKIAQYCYKVADPFSMELPVISNKEGKPVLIGELNRIIKKTFKAYGISTINASSHTLRKTFGKRVFESMGSSEAALVLLSKIFNHSSTYITKDYIGITKLNIQNAYLNI